MMCQSCKDLAAVSLRRIQSGGGALHTSHVRRRKPHCEYPETCTCRHRPVADNYVIRDGAA
jgi:hypothetical protein